ncbi:MAG: hypothetical protein N3D11_17870, partial [Candidatus Sumerlaeia bacterium]|nr:hypothetical protein [Candidatus Sumerlaeia bacterium]
MRSYHNDFDIPLDPRYVFVFGSNLAGRHGAGSARVAARMYQAEYGVGKGPTGRAYAIPTKDESLQRLPLEEIRRHVGDFIEHAKQNPDKVFWVTRVG